MKKRRLALLVTVLILFFSFVPAVPVQASDTTKIPLKVTFCQTEARKELGMVNSFRTGSEAWYWNSDNTTKTKPSLSSMKYDYNLEKVAMQRAVEIALYYSHTRADGASCWKTYSDCGYSSSASGENIAVGYTSAESVFEAWQENDDDYNGQGHRRNMLSSRFADCGFACVKYQGTYYWVQEFANGRNSSYTETAADNGTVVRYASILNSNISSFSTAYDVFQVGEKLNLTNEDTIMNFRIGNSSYSNVVEVAPSWTSSNSQVISVSGGVLSANSVGTATLNGSISIGDNNFTTTSPIEVVDSNITISPSTAEIRAGNASTYTISIVPDNAPYSFYDITWGIEDESIASIIDVWGSRVQVVGKAPGTTTLIAETADGLVKKTFPILVYQNVTRVSFEDEYDMNINTGAKKQLKATVFPNDATDKDIEWSSSNTDVATVTSDGYVVAVSPGQSQIRATAKDRYNTSSSKPYCAVTVNVVSRHLEWEYVDGKSYWYENNVRQGTVDDPQGVMGDGTIRGREIYDPASNAWYWLDSIYDGAKACGKEVWMPYIYKDEDTWDDEKKRNVAYESDEGMGEFVLNAIRNKKGKWVRYDENGRMLKGWVKIEGTLATIYPNQAGNIYYYDNRTGLMAKGQVTIDGKSYYFDEVTGALR